MHSTNYANAFIEVADDCKTEVGKIPPEKQEKTVAQLQYELISAHPYEYTSDEVIFTIYATRNGIAPAEHEAKQAEFFAKGQPCLRSSPMGGASILTRTPKWQSMPKSRRSTPDCNMILPSNI